MLKVLDLSTRLPGPYATKRLELLGATVSRIESSLLDPFIDEEMVKINPLFKTWYHSLNDHKKKLNLNLKNEEEFLKILAKIKESDIIISSNGPKFLKKVSELIDLKKEKKIFVNLMASKTDSSMHDLNALAKSELLNFHLKSFNQDRMPPPFLPIAGVTFGHAICEFVLSQIIKKSYGEFNLYLDEEVKNTVGLLKGDDSLALHNGLFPCYFIYKTKDHKHVALAAIEEKYWDHFLSASKIPLKMKDRFSTDQEVFETLEKFFADHSSKELVQMFHHTHACLSIF